MSTKTSYTRIQIRINFEIIIFSDFAISIYLAQISYARETNLLHRSYPCWIFLRKYVTALLYSILYTFDNVASNTRRTGKPGLMSNCRTTLRRKLRKGWLDQNKENIK